MQTEVPRLVDVAGETSVVYKEKPLYNRVRPIEGARARAERFEVKPDTLYLLASPLLWYGVGSLLERIPASSRLLPLEAEPGLFELSESRIPDIFRKSPQLLPLISGDTEAIFNTIREDGIERYRRVELLSLNGGYRLNSRFYKRLHAIMQEEIQQFWQNKYTLMHMGPLWIKNLFRNLIGLTQEKHSQPSNAVGLPRVDTPVLVVGAGPSLEKAYPFIKSHRDKFYLLAVDTAYIPLLSQGIHPDCIVVQEAQFANLYDFLPSPNIECRLLADLSSYPGVLRLENTGISYFLSEFTAMSLFERLKALTASPPLVPPLGSVGSTAVHLALRMTAAPVLMAGIDFSYYPGKTHSKGSPSHFLSLIGTERLRPLEDMYSRTAKGVRSIGTRKNGLLTTLTLERYARNFERIFSKENRLYRLPSDSLSLGIPILGFDELINVLLRWEKDFERDEKKAPVPEQKEESASLKELQRFMEEEVKLLRRIYDSGRAFLEGRQEGDESSDQRKELLSRINRAEYLFLHFPDTGSRLRSLDPTTVKRVLVSAGHYIRLIEGSLSNLH